MQTALLDPTLEFYRSPLRGELPDLGAGRSHLEPSLHLRGRQRAIRLLVVDDHALVRRGLAFWLKGHAHFEIVAEASDGLEAIQRARESNPDVVLMDIDMPNLNGLAATEMLRREQPNVKVLIFTMHRSPELVLQVSRLGARGYVLKEAPMEELLRAIELVHKGELFFGSEIADVALGRFSRRPRQGHEVKELSPREQQVLVALAEGLTNKEAAMRLDVGVRTIETHREAIMRKLGIRGVAALTKYAVARGLVAVLREGSPNLVVA